MLKILRKDIYLLLAILSANLFLTSLKKKKYSVAQYLVSPEQIGVPNRRLRYYLLARSDQYNPFENQSDIISNFEDFNDDFLSNKNSILNLRDFLNVDEEGDYEINKCLYFDQIYNNGINKSFFPNIQSLNSNISNCFTKSYGATQKSSGSVLFVKKDLDAFYESENLRTHNFKGLRYFSDIEISRLLCFNKDFKIFPSSGDFKKIKMNYQLLGNSVNVKVVSLLLKKLLSL